MILKNRKEPGVMASPCEVRAFRISAQRGTAEDWESKQDWSALVSMETMHITVPHSFMPLLGSTSDFGGQQL